MRSLIFLQLLTSPT